MIGKTITISLDTNFSNEDQESNNMNMEELGIPLDYINELTLSLIDEEIKVNYVDEYGKIHETIIPKSHVECDNPNDERVVWTERFNSFLDMEIFEWALCGGIEELMGIVAHRLVIGKTVPNHIKILQEPEPAMDEIKRIETWSNGTKSRKITDNNIFYADNCYDLQEEILEFLI